MIILGSLVLKKVPKTKVGIDLGLGNDKEDDMDGPAIGLPNPFNVQAGMM